MRFPTHPTIVKFMMLATAAYVRVLHATIEIAYEVEDPAAYPSWAGRPLVYVFWHEMLLFPAAIHARDATALVSRHRDGEVVAQALRFLGGSVVRGSTGRGGVRAVRDLLRVGRMRHLCINPDGPRGPRRVFQPGAVYLAGRLGVPIVPVGYAYSTCRRAKSWDRMAIPHPFCKGWGVTGPMMYVPAQLDRAGLEEHTRRLQQAMDRVQARAEALACGAKPTGLVATYSEIMSPAQPRRFRRSHRDRP